jgi:hypothetical protein
MSTPIISAATATLIVFSMSHSLKVFGPDSENLGSSICSNMLHLGELAVGDGRTFGLPSTRRSLDLFLVRSEPPSPTDVKSRKTKGNPVATLAAASNAERRSDRFLSASCAYVDEPESSACGRSGVHTVNQSIRWVKSRKGWFTYPTVVELPHFGYHF